MMGFLFRLGGKNYSELDYFLIDRKILKKLVMYTRNIILKESIDFQKDLLNNRLGLSYQQYRVKCSFNITNDNIIKVKGYEKLKTIGWYNKINNPTGLVKDHMVSVKYGYDNNISPEIIEHYKNCELLDNLSNILKSSKCSISLEDLTMLIKQKQ